MIDPDAIGYIGLGVGGTLIMLAVIWFVAARIREWKEWIEWRFNWADERSARNTDDLYKLRHRVDALEEAANK